MDQQSERKFNLMQGMLALESCAKGGQLVPSREEAEALLAEMRRLRGDVAADIKPVTELLRQRYAGDGVACAAYVGPDQNPDEHVRSFDAQSVIACLRAAIAAIEQGDQVAATRASGAAWFRIASFRHG